MLLILYIKSHILINKEVVKYEVSTPQINIAQVFNFLLLEILDFELPAEFCGLKFFYFIGSHVFIMYYFLFFISIINQS